MYTLRGGCIRSSVSSITNTHDADLKSLVRNCSTVSRQSIVICEKKNHEREYDLKTETTRIVYNILFYSLNR